jgi:tRNA1Val (adenine37-N6)-methyltransferase
MAKASQPFIFKQFQVIQEGGAWKVGTDSILLGSWCNMDHVTTALDMGTGSGILSLMLAQRNEEIQIDAVDIASEAIAEAKVNVQSSKWANRIRVIERDITNLDSAHREKYDLIICNPPYFPSGIAATDQARFTARQGSGFSLWDVPRTAIHYLKSTGKLNVVLPTATVFDFVTEANRHGLYVLRTLHVSHTIGADSALVLLELSQVIVQAENSTMVLYADDKPTSAYASMCRQFINV